MPLIEAAWHTADALRSRLRESATVEDLWDLLSEDGMALSASVEGWSSSHATVEMAAALNQLVVEQESLTGHLNLVSSAGTLVLRIADDSYSPVLFARTLSDLPRTSIVRETEDIEELTRAIAVHLQGQAAAYFELRYSEALRAIARFVEIAARAIGDLGSQKLVKFARAEARLNEGASYTGDMLAELAHARSYLPDDDIRRLGDLIREIEHLVSKTRFEQQQSPE